MQPKELVVDRAKNDSCFTPCGHTIQVSCIYASYSKMKPATHIHRSSNLLMIVYSAVWIIIGII